MGSSSFTRLYEHAGKPDRPDSGNVAGEIFRGIYKTEASMLGSKLAKTDHTATAAAQPKNMENLKNGKLPSDDEMKMMQTALLKPLYGDKPDAAAAAGKAAGDNLITHAIEGTKPHSFVAAEKHKHSVA